MLKGRWAGSKRKGNGSDKVVGHVEQAEAVMRMRSNCKAQRDYGKALYNVCNHVKGCLGKPKQFRRFTARY
jgi:hypothetical protein